MAEHAGPARGLAEPAASAKAPATAAPSRYGKLLNRGSEALAGYAQRLAPRRETTLGKCAQLLARSAGHTPPSSEVAQLKRVPVGFDRVAGTRSVDDSLVTTGLGNCIAVAAQDKKTGAAVMGHFDTVHSIDPETMKTKEGALQAFKAHLVEELRRAAGAAPDPVFHVSVGLAWIGGLDADSPAKDKWWYMRHSLLMACLAVFGTEPRQGGLMAEFFPATGTIRGSSTLVEGEQPITEPSDDPHGKGGSEIPYAALMRGVK